MLFVLRQGTNQQCEICTLETEKFHIASYPGVTKNLLSLHKICIGPLTKMFAEVLHAARSRVEREGRSRLGLDGNVEGTIARRFNEVRFGQNRFYFCKFTNGSDLAACRAVFFVTGS